MYFADPVRWEVANGLQDYEQAVARMEVEVAAIAKGTRTQNWFGLLSTLPSILLALQPNRKTS